MAESEAEYEREMQLGEEYAAQADRPAPQDPFVAVLTRGEGSLILFALRHLEHDAEAGHVDLNGRSTESAQAKITEGMAPRA